MLETFPNKLKKRVEDKMTKIHDKSGESITGRQVFFCMYDKKKPCLRPLIEDLNIRLVPVASGACETIPVRTLETPKQNSFGLKIKDQIESDRFSLVHLHREKFEVLGCSKIAAAISDEELGLNSLRSPQDCSLHFEPLTKRFKSR